MLTLYGISNCDTVKKAKKWLENNNLDYNFHDYKKQGCPTSLVQEFTEHFALEQLINKRGTTWRNLDSQAKQNLASDFAITLMSENPSLIKRPILHRNNQWLIGFATADYDTLVQS
ncbi:MAG: Spx/MgsR family transcriptional regulator [Pseudohongiellaceae bacterium]|jgi:Spx/MgsR family transcriptional regulator